MKNKFKNFRKITDIAMSGECLAVTMDKKITTCRAIECKECLLRRNVGPYYHDYCEDNRHEWLEEEADPSTDNKIEYKGYAARINYDADKHVLYGEVEGIPYPKGIFTGYTGDEIEKAFHDVVDAYKKGGQ